MFPSRLPTLTRKSCGLSRLHNILSFTENYKKSTVLFKNCKKSFSVNQDFFETTRKGNALLSQKEIDEFLSFFPCVVNDLTDNNESHYCPPVDTHFNKLLNYLVPNGKKNRAMILLASYKTLDKQQNLTSENLKLANLLAWVIEMYGSFLVLIDDIIDQSDTRSGAPSWHTVENRCLESINDGFYLEQATYALLTKHFSNHEAYIPLIKLFLDTGLKTTRGEALDCMSNLNKQPNWKIFTMENFSWIAKHKTTYYSFYLPIFAAMHLAKIKDTALEKQLEKVLMRLGEFYQIQNDFWDVYIDSYLTGREGNDIREGKCTWLTVTALEKSNPTQRKILMENYGKPSCEAENAVRNMFEELDIRVCYEKYQEESLNSIRNDIKKIPERFPHQLLYNIVEKIYKKL